ncbi:MAG: wax ester/triacylglycerol synthase family O-acyltransferase [Chloroflexi bacterium]|nr:wax ester/triacylglycerol synthase family O-acyltransferase [Chloroflexota bacterium]
MQFLGPVDTAFYMVDTPETPMNIGAMTVFEGKIAFDAFLKLIEARIYQIPLYQQKVIQAPLNLGQPMWAFDPDFYVGNHVFRMTLEQPGTDEQLRELAGHLVSGKLDRSKPLWEIYLIEGLEGDRTGVFFKIHHCMVDGLAAVELFTLLLDVSPEAVANPKKPVYDPPYLPSTGQLIVESVKRDIPHKFNMLRKVGSDVLSLGSVLADKEKRRKAFIGMAYLLNDNLKPISKLPINGKNTGRMTLGWAEFSLAEVRAIRAAANASVNDVMLTLLGMAVERYIRDLGEKTSQTFLRALVPVSMRQEEEKGDFGNRISVLPIDIPFGVSDPLERLRRVAEYTSVMKNSSLSKGLDLVLTFPSLMPSLAQPLIWQAAPVAFSLLAHTWCTNVTGPQIPIYLLGHQMLHSYGYFPLNPSMGLACVITSYNQKISMTLVADAGIVPDVTELAKNLKDSYYALRTAAKVPQMEPIAAESKVTPPGEAKAAPVVEAQPVEPKPAPTAEAQPAEGETMTEPVAAPAVVADAVSQPAVTTNDNDATRPALTPVAATELVERAADIMPVESPQVTPVTVSPVSEERSNGFAPQPELAAMPAADPAGEASSANGAVGQPVPAVAAPAVEAPPATSNPPEKPKLFSEEWAQAYHEAINNNKGYHNASTRWEAGALSFIMKASPRHGFPRDSAVWLDLHKGVCRAAKSIQPHEADRLSAFVIEGDYATWMDVLGGRAQPLVMIMRGKLRLKKGSITRLLPFTQSAQELIHSAQAIS